MNHEDLQDCQQKLEEIVDFFNNDVAMLLTFFIASYSNIAIKSIRKTSDTSLREIHRLKILEHLAHAMEIVESYDSIYENE